MIFGLIGQSSRSHGQKVGGWVGMVCIGVCIPRISPFNAVRIIRRNELRSVDGYWSSYIVAVYVLCLSVGIQWPRPSNKIDLYDCRTRGW